MKIGLHIYIVSILVSGLISGLFSSTSWGQSAPRFTIDGSTLTSTQKEQVANQFIEAYNLLPPIMKSRLTEGIKFDKYQLKLVPMDPHVAGETNYKGQILINSNLLNNPAHITRIMIHEISHIYDFLKVIPKDIQDTMETCEILRNNSDNNSDADLSICDLYKDLNTTVSTMPDFLDATGWYQRINGEGKRIKETTFGFRSPDPYEATTPKEMFAVNMEYFLTDSEYQCRRPSIYRYFVRHFGYTPFPSQTCQNNLTFIDPNFTKAQNAIHTINPDRVYAIHYLLAGSGQGLISAFGHAMVRVVVCAPERTVVGPDCLKDIQHHIVLSFRGFVDTPQIDGWAGLTGGYKSRLFFIPFPQIINEYNVTQLRDLYSHPLNLSRFEIRTFLERAVEVHWSYNSNYYFLSNNCAVEIMNLLKSGVVRGSLMNSRAQTPKGVLRELKRQKVLSDEVDFNNLDQAKGNGYYFPSYGKSLDQALAVIQTLSGQKYSLSKWKKLNPLDRRNIFISRTFAAPLPHIKWAAAFLFLERYLNKEITQSTYNSFLQTDLDPNSAIGQQTKSYVDKILKTLSIDQELTGPASIAKVGYGLPSTAELTQVEGSLQNIQQQRDANQSAIDSLIKQLIHLYSDDEIQQSKENITIFAQGLKN